MDYMKKIKLEKNLLVAGATVFAAALIASVIYTDSKIFNIKRQIEETFATNKKSTYFVLDVRKTASGKYYNEFTIDSRPRGPDSTRTCLYNLDKNPDTIEQFVRYVPFPAQNSLAWKVKENLILPGFHMYDITKPENKNQVMTLEKQKEINEMFKKESKYVETDPIIEKRKEYKKVKK